MSALTNIENNPHRDFYEIPDNFSTTHKVLLIIAAFLLAGALTITIISLSSSILGNISVRDKLTIGIQALPLIAGGLSIVSLLILYSLSPTVRESFELYHHISEDEVEKIKKRATLEEVKDLLIKYPYANRRNVNLGEHVRNGKLTPDNIQFLDRMMVEYYGLLNANNSAGNKIQALEAEWQKERSKWV